MPLRILVVDDEPEILQMTSSVLVKRQHEVTTAPNGIAALAEVRKNLPDLILLDVLMPEMDGYTLYKELKNNPVTSDIPVLIITGRGKMEDAFKVLGVDGFIAKPFTPDKLMDEIDLIMSTAEARRKIFSREHPETRKKILGVGPQPGVLENMGIHARKAECAIETVPTGAEAIAKAVKFLPDIIFIDVQLGDISACEVVEVLRRIPQLSAKPIIGYCYYETDALAQSDVRKKVLDIDEAGRRFMQCGATGYMGRFAAAVFVQALIDNLRNPAR